MIEKVMHGSMGRCWYRNPSKVGRPTRREETTGIRSLAYGWACCTSALPYKALHNLLFKREWALTTAIEDLTKAHVQGVAI